MDGATQPIDPELLLANSAWLHALARSLVADDHRADDVVQQTFAAAVEHPPGDGVPLRPWLARVARNFSLKALRSDGRRAFREARVPAPPPTASPAESVARAETFRDVVDAVLALEPIYRDVVIARFFDGLEMAAVAARLGVPEETARTRLKRALAMLRDRLDRKHGDRRAWAVLLVGRRAAPTAAGVGGAIVAWKIGVAAAVAFAVAGGWFVLRTEDAPGDVAFTAPGETAKALEPRHPSPRSRAPRPAKAAPAEVDPADGAATPVATVLSPAATLDVRCVDPSGVAVVSFGVRYEVLGDSGTGGMAGTDDAGRCEFPVPADSVVRITAQTMGLASTSVAVPTGPAGAPPVTVTLRVAPDARLVGVVRDPDGNAAAGAIVRAMPSGAQPADFDRTRGGLEGKADEKGRFSLDEAVRGRRYDVVATAARSAPSLVAEDVVVPEGAIETTRDLELRRCSRLVVRVTGRNGEPASDGRVVVILANGTESVEPQSPGVFVWPKFPPGEVSLMAMAPGQSPCTRVVDVPPDGSTEVTMVVGGPTPALAGVVVDETGAGVAAAKVSARIAVSAAGSSVADVATSDSTGHFRGSVFGDGPLVVDATAPGHLPLRGLELPGPSESVRIVTRRAATVTFRLVAEEDAPPIRTIRLLFGGSAHADMVCADDVGTVRLDKEPCGGTEMRLHVERFALVVRRVTLDAGTVDDLGEIRLVAPAPLRGRVVDAAGRPVANAAVRLDMDDADLMLKSVRTDADGAFTAPIAPPSGTVPLRVEAPGFLTLQTSFTVDGDAPVTLRLARGGVVWGEVVDASGAPVPGVAVSVIDADGAKVTIDADDCGLFGARVRPGRAAVSSGAASTTTDVADGGESHVRLVVSER